MVLFTVITLTVIILAILAIIAFSTVGAASIVVFGDVIVCVLVLVWVLKKLVFKKR